MCAAVPLRRPHTMTSRCGPSVPFSILETLRSFDSRLSAAVCVCLLFLPTLCHYSCDTIFGSSGAPVYAYVSLGTDPETGQRILRRRIIAINSGNRNYRDSQGKKRKEEEGALIGQAAIFTGT